jgi:hypothetical protein
MTRYFIGDEIKLFLSASKFLKMVKNHRTRENILRVRFIPPVLGSNSLGNYKVTLKYEPKQKSKLLSTIE